MTPKEKALELFHLFENHVESIDVNNNVAITDFGLKKENQKQCALICINEKIEMLKKASDLNMLYRSDLCVYYQQVEQEIKNL